MLTLMRTLEQEFRQNRRLRMLRATGHCSAVIASPLFDRCKEIQKVLENSKPLDNLEKLMTKYAIPRPSCGLPPYSPKLTLTRLEQIYPRLAPERFYTVQLPENHPSFDQRRAGLILRQHLSNGQIKALFIAGTEQNSPANRHSTTVLIVYHVARQKVIQPPAWGLRIESMHRHALNLRCGDRLVAISGFPLNWRTLELHRFGLLDAEELKGLQFNANLHDLARHLLDEPYRLDRYGSDPKINRAKPLLVLISRKKNVELHGKRGSDGSITHSSKPDKTGTSKDTCDVLYRETVLDASNPDSGLGLQLGFDEDANGVYIVSIFPNSQAAVDGILREGDRITEINYDGIERMDPREALKKIKSICQKTSFVQLKVARPVHDLDDHPVQLLAPEYDISNSTCGLGLSLEGTMEQEEGDLNPVPHHYIVDLTPKGPVERLGILKAEDELLEINDQILYGEDHLKVARILHNINLTGYLICARYQRVDFPITSLEDHPEETKHQAEQTSPRIRQSDVDSIYFSQPVACPVRKRSIGVDEALPNAGKEDGKDQEHVLVEYGSEDNSDVDRNPTPSKVIFARSIHRSDDEGTESSNQLTVLRINQETEASEEIQLTRFPDPGHDPEAEDKTSVDGPLYTPGYSRLPMPARLARLSDEIPQKQQKQHQHRVPIHHRSTASSLNRVEVTAATRSQSMDAIYQPDKNCLRLTLTKSAGEFLGKYIESNRVNFSSLEIDAEDGGPNGIMLLGVIPDSPLDRLRSAGKKTPAWDSRSSLHRYSSSSERQSGYLPPKTGDWIAAVAGYTFRNRPNFKARRLLRRLVVSAGMVE
ncbi:unnamed protein product [Echinostoma caproni]|uniref:PDZ domain-containing protein n=1 Tax=Echinostoma caproni TaxID=27848 RepID=A0A183ABI7_9TREM|nr:unnamed protein product [Echinostoma caproni]